ncbi:MAG TPA: LuxR C-terminal-related transcriptional regulator [Solirubrobacteraceae bacterium]|nr:LuxR C-terminal-related transcriptional regulator [Solirubrobacteraceae bacterium]
MSGTFRRTATGGRTKTQPNDRLVARESLFGRLASASRVTLVCAPAGSGKSVLVRSWIETEGLSARTAWVSVERGEGDAQRFWLMVVAALADIAGRDELVARVSPSPVFRGDAVVERLRSDLASLEDPVLLVIDDLHELDSADALLWLERFLGNRPAMVRVVLLTRVDPRIGLHRLRLAGELTEIRGPDLRFTLEETHELLVRSGIELSEASTAALYERTEGWAAGLRLAALSLAGHPDPERFVSEFSGSERTVAGYLLEEVLERQTPEVRELLLRTSVLERVSGPLADYLTGRPGSERILQELEDTNAFVTSVDVGRTWFRYHHLFADLLQLELRRVAPASVPPLHRAAAEWLEENGEVVEAISHAQAARDWPHASRLLADHCLALILDGRLARVRALIAALPARLVAQDAELALVSAADRVLDGPLEDALAYLALAERLSSGVPADRRRVFDEELATLTLWVARRRGDLDTAVEAMHALETALDGQDPPFSPPGREISEAEVRASALLNLGIVELWSMRLADARGHLEQALALSRRIDRPYLQIGSLAHLAIAGAMGGSPVSSAIELCKQAIAIAEEHGWENDAAIAAPFAIAALGLVRLARFEEAEHCLERAEQTIRRDSEPATELVLHHARGVSWLGQHRLEEALSAFRAAEQSQTVLASQHLLAIELRSRIVETEVLMGDTAGAQAELERMPVDLVRRAELRVAAAALALAENDPERVLDLVAPVLDRSVAALHARWTTIDALLFAAAARDEAGDRRESEDTIEQALELAEPEGIILPFMLAPVEGLLDRHPRHRTAHAALLSEIRGVLAGSPREHRGEQRPLLDELSEAELRVVRYLPSNLKVPEIASELFVSNNTVRTHLRHIYQKLDAHSRSEAVDRARELGLLSPSRRLR